MREGEKGAVRLPKIPVLTFAAPQGFLTTGAGKIFHPGTSSGGPSSSEGGGEGGFPFRPNGSWSQPYFFCDQFCAPTPAAVVLALGHRDPGRCSRVAPPFVARPLTAANPQRRADNGTLQSPVAQGYPGTHAGGAKTHTAALARARKRACLG